MNIIFIKDYHEPDTHRVIRMGREATLLDENEGLVRVELCSEMDGNINYRQYLEFFGVSSSYFIPVKDK